MDLYSRSNKFSCLALSRMMWHSTIQSVSSPNYKQNFKKAKSIKPYKALNSGIKAYKAHHQDTQFRHQSLKRHQVTQFRQQSLKVTGHSKI